MGVVHVERLSEQRITRIGRPVKKRTAMGKGVEERYSIGRDGLLLELGGERAQGSLEAEERQEGDVNHGRQQYGEDGLEFGRGLNFGEGAAETGETLYSHIRLIHTLTLCLEVKPKEGRGEARSPSLARSLGSGAHIPIMISRESPLTIFFSHV